MECFHGKHGNLDNYIKYTFVFIEIDLEDSSNQVMAHIKVFENTFYVGKIIYAN